MTAAKRDAALVVSAERDRLKEINAELVNALKIIAGERQCVDNLMGNEDVARAVLATTQEELGDRAAVSIGHYDDKFSDLRKKREREGD